MPHPAGGGELFQGDRAADLEGRGSGTGRGAPDLRGRGRRGRRGAGLWRDAVGRDRAAGDPGLEGAGAGGDSLSLRLHGLRRLSVAGADQGERRGERGSRGGGDVRRGRGLGAEAAGAALCGDRVRRRRGRAADRVGDAGPDLDARRRGRFSGRGAVPGAGGGVPGGGRGGGEAELRRRLVGVFRAAGGRGGSVPFGPAVGRRQHRLRRDRLVSAAGRLAGGRLARRGRRSGRRGRVPGTVLGRLSGRAGGGRRGLRLVLRLGRRPGGAGADAHP